MTFRDVGEGSLWLRSWRVDRGREKQESLPGRARGGGRKAKGGEQVGGQGSAVHGWDSGSGVWGKRHSLKQGLRGRWRSSGKR